MARPAQKWKVEVAKKEGKPPNTTGSWWGVGPWGALRSSPELSHESTIVDTEILKSPVVVIPYQRSTFQFLLLRSLIVR